MMHELLAHVYGALVKDDEATACWVELIKMHIRGTELLELTCGSGEIIIALAQEGYHVDVSDLSTVMAEEAKKKDGSEQVSWNVMNICDLHTDKSYDGILCLRDSFNYLLKDKQMHASFRGACRHLRDNSVFLVDMHSMDRLEEFAEEYNEAGHVKDLEYQWIIASEDDRIYQNLAFCDSEGRVTLEQHKQRVYEPVWILAELKNAGFQVEVYMDFTQAGICEGEERFYICRKAGGI